jgi:hypothetical protein
MRTALECRQHADHCERLARASEDESNRRMMIGVADLWRSLAAGCERHARIMAASYAGPIALPRPDKRQ